MFNVIPSRVAWKEGGVEGEGSGTGQTARRTSPGQNPSVVFYTYDADGKLSRKAPAGQGAGTVYIADVYEKDTYTGEVVKYYFAAGQRIAMRKGASLYYLTQDHLGGTALVTDASGAMVSRIRYFPYGGVRTIEGTNPPPTDKLFTGQQRETTNGIYHYKARMYNADIGRMPQADSTVPDGLDPQAYNRYSYVNNNPVKYADPCGHSYRQTCYGEWRKLNVAYLKVWQSFYFDFHRITGWESTRYDYWPKPWVENTNIKVTIAPWVSGPYWRWYPYLMRVDVRARFVETTWIFIWPIAKTWDVLIYIDFWYTGACYWAVPAGY